MASLTTKRHSIVKFSGTAKQTQQIQCGELLQAEQLTANSAWQVWRNGRCLWAKQAQRKWGGVWAGETSLSRCSHLWHAFGLNLKGFFTHFIVVSSRFIVNFSYFIVVFSRLFAYKRHFLGYFVFLKFLNALFVRFLRLSLRAVFTKTAWQSINSALFLLFGLPRSLCSLAMTARHKFKFFTQNSRLFANSNHLINSRHFINSTHFITLSQILSPTQGFFISLPQIFAQFLLINSLQRSSYGRQDTKAPF